MKKKSPSSFRYMHWSATLLIRLGISFSVITLLLGFLAKKASFLAIAHCKTAVFMFAISVIGGFLFDVIALRMGMRDSE